MDNIQPITFHPRDWDEVRQGWRCPLLDIPGTEIEELTAKGSLLAVADYEVDKPNKLVRYTGNQRPRTVVAKVSMPPDVVPKETAERLQFWKIVLPFIASVLSIAATIAAVFLKSYLDGDSQGPSSGKMEGVQSISSSSVDALALVGPLIENSTKQTTLTLAGINFHITADDRDDELIEAARRGCKIRVLVMAPSNDLMNRYGQEYNHDDPDFSNECASSLRDLMRIRSSVKEIRESGNANGSFDVRVLNFIPGHRVYLLNKGLGGTSGIAIPYSEGIKASDSPAVILDGEGAMVDHYNTSTDWLWDVAEDAEKWIAENNFEEQ